MKAKRRLGIAAAVLAIAAPAYWWLLVESGTPDGVFALDLAELRTLANARPGAKPSAVEVEQVAVIEFPGGAVRAGAGWGFVQLPVFSYQLVLPDDTVVVDTTMDEATAKGSYASSFDAAAFVRVQRALERASAIVVTHEHYDHLGGLVAHPQFAELQFLLTDEQLADPDKRKPLIIPPEVLRAHKPLSFERGLAVAPGVVLWKAPGHTPGSQLVFVQLQNGEEFLFLGDVAWHRGNVEQVRERARLVTLILGEDRQAVLRQLAAVKALAAAEPRLHVVPGHDGPVIEQWLDAGVMHAGFSER